MRHKDRGVLDIGKAFGILARSDTVRNGLRGGEYPYVVPVSFGAEMAGGKPVVYFHCAQQSLNLALPEENPRVCVEGDIFLGVETTDQGITTRYESVIGFGTCEIVEDGEETAHGLHVLTAHYGYDDYPSIDAGAWHASAWGRSRSTPSPARGTSPGNPSPMTESLRRIISRPEAATARVRDRRGGSARSRRRGRPSRRARG